MSHSPLRNSIYSYGNPQRKSPGKTVIAHISDLHFRSSTQGGADEWKALRSDLASQKIDFFAVTGDLIDNSLQDNLKANGVNQAFDNVLEFLISLCATVEIDPETCLGVVPGNHDHRIKGLFTKLSYRDEFYKRFANYYRPKLLPSLRCSLFTFDSNTVDPRINFASGRINNDDIVEFSDSVRAMAQDHMEELASCTKVVLVHHHPMPIAATELTPSFINSDEYHLLKNAGLFMTEMVRHKVDLILHGHKHYAALSKAIFPLLGEEDHTISIVAAGSVSARREQLSSYNILTIEDSGEIHLARKTRELATYGKPTWSTTLHSYEATRQIRIPKLATLMNTQLKGEKYTRLTTIQEGSGDAVNSELYGNVQSYLGEGVSTISQRYSSASGRSGDPKLAGDQMRMTWEWEDQTVGTGKIRFDPPIKNAVTFQILTEMHNALHFNKEDRLLVSGSDSHESINTRIRQVYDLLVIKVSFPINFSPQRIWLEVYDERNIPDRAEQNYGTPRLTPFNDDNSILFVLEKPLPGYRYNIVWELPENESEQLHLRESDRKFAEEIQTCLLKLRAENDTYRLNQVEQRLHNLKAALNVGIGGMPLGANDLEIAIHCFDPEARGLVSVVFIGASPPDTPIGIGDTVIGQAYKRREVVGLSTRKRPVDGRDPYDYDDGHSGVLSIPLLYPSTDGQRVGVITLATRSRTASFLRLLDADLSLEDQSAFHVLVDEVFDWYTSSLIPALDLPT